MKKPVNRFAVGFWVLAVLVFLADAGQYISMIETMKKFAGQDNTYLVQGGLWRFLLSGILSTGQFAAFGVIIELIDQIRWNALQRTK
jgi:hypothetical protein